MSTRILFEKQWMKWLSLVVIILLAGSVLSLIAMTTRSVNDLGVFGPEEEQVAVASRNLIDYSAEDVLAYRWQAMARYYAQAPANGRNLTDYSADEVLTYRWQAMAQYYADHPEIRRPVQH